MATVTNSSRRTRKIAAIAAGILVVGVAATYTLASWTDSEWVWGGANGDAGIGTSEFEVEQSVNGGTDWTNDLASPGGELTFTANPLALTPGDTIYAPVSLRTLPTSVAGDVTLKAAVPNTAVADTSPELWDAVRVTAYTSAATAAPACEAPLTDWTAITGVEDVQLGTDATVEQRLNAGTPPETAGDPQHYCLTITLPEGTTDIDTLQGQTIAPVWRFDSVSVAP